MLTKRESKQFRRVALAALSAVSIIASACGGGTPAALPPPPPTVTTAKPTTAPTPMPAPAQSPAAAPATVIAQSPVAAVGVPSPGAAPAPAAAAAVATSPRGGEIRIGVSLDVEGFDPAASRFSGQWGVYNIYDSLLSLDRGGSLAPSLATGWTVDSPTQITFKLRSGVKFQDGTDFNAEAVKFSIERTLDPKQNASVASFISDIDRVDVVDPLTARLVLKKPSGPVLFYMAQRPAMIVSPTAVNKAGDDFANNPVGTGPYEFVEWVKNDHISLKRNESYWDKEHVLPDRVTFRIIPDPTVRLTALKTGQVDIIDGVHPKDVATVKTDPTLTYQSTPDPGFWQVWFNCTAAPFDKKENRLAVFYATDKQALINTTEFGTAIPARTAIAPNLWAYDSGIANPKPDLDKAKQLLAQAGNPSGFTSTFEVYTDPLSQSRAQVLQAQWKQIGVNVELQARDITTVITDLVARNFNLIMTNSAYRGDPDASTYGNWYSTAGMNRGKCSAADVDAPLDQARATYDLAQRKAAYGKAEQAELDNALQIYLMHSPLEVVTTKKIVGYTLVPDFYLRMRLIGTGIQN